MHRGHKCLRKKFGISYWQILESLGVTREQVAGSINVNKSSVSRAFDPGNDFAFSIEKLRKLRDLAAKKISDIIQAVFQFGPAQVTVLCTDYDTSAPSNQDTEKAILKAIQDRMASLLAGQSWKTKLPDTVFGATIQLGTDQECVYIITTKTLNIAANHDSLIHEYEHLADHFKEEARKLRKLQGRAEEKLRLPKKRLL